ncbi:lytic transglycosylase domain-containing protein [Taibaiella soli]|nr:lytic transglycosylase domain-containing protein [Taibaiella soli]
MLPLRSLFVTLFIVFTTYASWCMNGIDTTDNKIAYYRTSVNRNKNVVQFIDKALQAYGLPKALHNLALIESDFNRSIISTANAVGTWQITPVVASDYGLRIDSTHDERYDLYKSTQVACRNLADLYGMYKNWILVVAAYNCGAGRVNKAIAKAGSSNYADFFRFLPNETIMHVYKFQLACYANNDRYEIRVSKPESTPGADELPQTRPGISQINISAGYKLLIIADKLQLPLEELQRLNPDFEKKINETGSTLLYLPTDKMPDFVLMQTEVLSESLETEQ